MRGRVGLTCQTRPVIFRHAGPIDTHANPVHTSHRGGLIYTLLYSVSIKSEKGSYPLLSVITMKNMDILDIVFGYIHVTSVWALTETLLIILVGL